jgi:hypothetical protein
MNKVNKSKIRVNQINKQTNNKLNDKGNIKKWTKEKNTWSADSINKSRGLGNIPYGNSPIG